MRQLKASMADRIKKSIEKKIAKYNWNKTLKSQSPEWIFTEIHNKNGWQGEQSTSGKGSDHSQTREVSQMIPAIITRYNVHTMLDVPCGDFHWMKEIDLSAVHYTGGDIVESLVNTNQMHFSSDKIDFKKIDLITSKLNRYDLIFCRDCLVHLSNSDIIKAINNIVLSGSRYLLTTTFTEREENQDILTGQWHPINLQKKPFDFPPPLELYNEHCTQDSGRFSDKSLGLWDIDKLK